MDKWEIEVDKDELQQIMKQHDKDQDNEIDFDEFIRIFIQDPKELKKLKLSPD